MNQPRSTRADATLGYLAELLVSRWLYGQGWDILHHRWHCRWGELDLVARSSLQSTGRPVEIVFVEVKARRDRNLDADGALAITAQKQAKLWQAANLYLASFPALAELPCRFDVALVSGRIIAPLPSGKASETGNPPLVKTWAFPAIELGQEVVVGGYGLTLRRYLSHAFDGDVR